MGSSHVVRKQEKKDTAKIVLGIPIDNLTIEETVDAIFDMMGKFKDDNRSRYVSTVNVDFLVNALGWLPNQTARHPELLQILRHSDLVTADGMPVVWLSKLLGEPLKQRVTGADLVPMLSQRAGEMNGSIFLLGGREEIARKAGKKLLEISPGLRLAGVSSPFVHTEGELMDEEEADLKLVEEINKAKPDILFIGFGNPKQEIWFERNKDRLKVPVSLGIGGTYEFIVGTVSRAPVWMQKTGTEWIYRISQDPKRLWKRYFIGMLKLGVMAAPLLFHKLAARFQKGGSVDVETQVVVAQNINEEVPDFIDTLNHASGNYTVINMPSSVDESWILAVSEHINGLLEKDERLVFDLSGVQSIDSFGVNFLFDCLKTCKERDKSVYFVSLNDESLVQLLKVNRLYDFFLEHSFKSVESLLKQLSDENSLPPFNKDVEMHNDHCVVRLFGRLDVAQMRELDVPALLEETQGRSTVIDMSFLDFVDSSGLVLFIKLRKHFDKSGQKLCLSGMNETVQQVFKITKLHQLFEIRETNLLALSYLDEV